MNTTTNAPRAWVGCLACYNAGRLVGAWYDAHEAEDDLDTIHTDGGYTGHCNGDEPWCFDTDNLPGGEMDPATAQRWGEAYEELANDSQWPAFLAYCENFGQGDLLEVADFEEAYKGKYAEFSDYIYELEQETGLMEDWPEIAVRHFDWDGFSEECEQDYLLADAPGGVFIFWAHG